MLERTQGWVLFAMAILLLSPAAAGSTGQDDLDLGTLSLMNIESQGTSFIKTDEGTVTLEPTSNGWIHLAGKEVQVTTAWETGIRSQGDPSIGSVVTDHGIDTHDFKAAEVDIDPRHGAFIAAFGQWDVETFVPSDARFTARSDRLEIGAGNEEGSMSLNNASDMGFWHSIDGPVVEAAGKGIISGQGDFTVFPHEVEISITHGDDHWESWTGMHLDDPDALVTEYELRITVIELKEASLSTSPETFVLYATAMDTKIGGKAVATGVVGQLETESGLVLFEQETARLQGPGDIDIKTTKQSGITGDTLLTRPSPQLTVEGGRLVAVPDSSEGGLATQLFIPLLLSGPIVLGATGFFVARHPGVWMKMASRAFEQEDYKKASRFYRKIVRKRWDEPIAWYNWARSELLLGNLEQAETIIDHAENVPYMDSLDLLELRAHAKWGKKDFQSLNRILLSISDQSLPMARAVLSDLPPAPGFKKEDFHWLVENGTQEVHLDGYA